AVALHAVRVRVLPGHQCRPERRAHRVLTYGPGAGDARRRQGVEVRRRDVRVAVARERLVAQLIGDYPQDVGAISAGLLLALIARADRAVRFTAAQPQAQP